MTATGLVTCLLAPFIGSFLGVLAARLPDGRDWLWSRSACERCARRLGPLELVPLLSFVWLRGRCAGCGQRIGWSHPAFELASLLVALLVVVCTPPDTALTVAGCCLGWWCLLLAVIDWRHFRLPDALTLTLLLAGLGVTALLDAPDLGAHTLGAVVGWTGFTAIAWLYRRLRGVDGLGAGDAKLLAAAGAWLGLAMLSWVVLLAAMLTLAVVLVVSLSKGHLPGARLRVPFGPGLAASLFVCWLWQV